MWKVYARGLTGKLAGLVFRWSSVEAFPVEGVQELIWGLDFGYTQDPTALTKVAVMKGGGYVVQELTYQAGIAMEDIYEIARRNGYYHDQPVYCDHDKELIVQLRRLSMLALPAEKGEILNGILYCKQQDIRYTANSRNMANELMRYKFVEINGVATNKPIDAWNHTLDSVRYAIFSHRNRKKLSDT
jgi:phage terminase large subunit